MLHRQDAFQESRHRVVSIFIDFTSGSGTLLCKQKPRSVLCACGSGRRRPEDST